MKPEILSGGQARQVSGGPTLVDPHSHPHRGPRPLPCSNHPAAHPAPGAPEHAQPARHFSVTRPPSTEEPLTPGAAQDAEVRGRVPCRLARCWRNPASTPCGLRAGHGGQGCSCLARTWLPALPSSACSFGHFSSEGDFHFPQHMKLVWRPGHTSWGTSAEDPGVPPMLTVLHSPAGHQPTAQTQTL